MNPSTSITDDLLAQLRGMPLAQLAQQLGVSEQQTQSAWKQPCHFCLALWARTQPSLKGRRRCLARWSATMRLRRRRQRACPI